MGRTGVLFGGFGWKIGLAIPGHLVPSSTRAIYLRKMDTHDHSPDLQHLLSFALAPTRESFAWFHQLPGLSWWFNQLPQKKGRQKGLARAYLVEIHHFPSQNGAYGVGAVGRVRLLRVRGPLPGAHGHLGGGLCEGAVNVHIGVLFSCFGRKIDGDSWFTWWFNHRLGRSYFP